MEGKIVKGAGFFAVILTAIDAVDGELYVGGQLPINFAAEENYLTSLSFSLSQESANGTGQVQWGNYYLTGDGQSDLQIFDIKGLALQGVSSLVMANIPDNSTILFNVSGSYTGLTNMGFGSLGNIRNYVLFNFWEATTLDLSGVGVEGSILAPLAHINAYNGVVNGTTIAASWSGSVQQNLHSFTSYGPEDSAPIPEPATMLLFGTGLVGMAGTLLKRRKK